MGTYKYRTIKCISCGEEKSGNYSPTAKYCSRECYDTKRPSRVKRDIKTKKCKWCKNKFDTKDLAATALGGITISVTINLFNKKKYVEIN